MLQRGKGVYRNIIGPPARHLVRPSIDNVNLIFETFSSMLRLTTGTLR